MPADPPPPGPPAPGRPRPRGDDPARRRLRRRRPARRTPSASGPPANPAPGWTSPTSRRTPHEVDVLHLHTGARTWRPSPGSAGRRRSRRLGLPLVVTVHRVPPAGGRPHRGRSGYEAHLEAVLAHRGGGADPDARAPPTRSPTGSAARRSSSPTRPLAVPDPGARVPSAGSSDSAWAAGAGRPGPGRPVRAALSGAVSGGGRLRVLADDERHVGRAVREPGRPRGPRARRPPAAERPAQLQQLHVAVLPEPPGTHSPDLEICRDVGTRVVAPSCGWSADQWSEVVSYGNRRERPARPALAHRGGRRRPDPADAAAGRPGLAGRAAGRRPGGARGRLPAGGRRPRVGLSARHSAWGAAMGAGRGWVSYMRTMTTTPDTAVRAATAQIAASMRTGRRGRRRGARRRRSRRRARAGRRRPSGPARRGGRRRRSRRAASGRPSPCRRRAATAPSAQAAKPVVRRSSAIATAWVSMPPAINGLRPIRSDSRR